MLKEQERPGNKTDCDADRPSEGRVLDPGNQAGGSMQVSVNPPSRESTTQANDVTCDVPVPCAAQRYAPVHALESEASGHVAAVTGDQANDQRDVTSSDQPTEDSSSENLDNIKSVEGDHNELKKAAVTGDQANDQRDVTSSDQPTEDSSSENLDNIKSVEGDHNELKKAAVTGDQANDQRDVTSSDQPTEDSSSENLDNIKSVEGDHNELKKAAVTGDLANDHRDVTSSDQPTEDSSSENLDNIKSVEGDHNELKMETDIEGEFCIQKNPENETSKICQGQREKNPTFGAQQEGEDNAQFDRRIMTETCGTGKDKLTKLLEDLQDTKEIIFNKQKERDIAYFEFVFRYSVRNKLINKIGNVTQLFGLFTLMLLPRLENVLSKLSLVHETANDDQQLFSAVEEMTAVVKTLLDKFDNRLESCRLRAFGFVQDFKHDIEAAFRNMSLNSQMASVHQQLDIISERLGKTLRILEDLDEQCEIVIEKKYSPTSYTKMQLPADKEMQQDDVVSRLAESLRVNARKLSAIEFEV